MIDPKYARKIARTIYGDTITARMLRMLQARGTWAMSEFMAEYHRRCDREARGGSAGRSSFACNFSRYTYTRYGLVERYGAPHGNRKVATWLRWSGPSAGEILTAIDARLLDELEIATERNLLNPAPTDLPDDHTIPLADMRAAHGARTDLAPELRANSMPGSSRAPGKTRAKSASVKTGNTRVSRTPHAKAPVERKRVFLGPIVHGSPLAWP